MIQEYISYLHNIRGYSANTCLGYEKDLKFFTRWAKENCSDARWSKLTREDIDKYIEYCVSCDLKPSTTNRRLAAISGIYRFFKRQGLDVENPARFESRRKVGERIPNTIPHKDLESAYEHAKGDTRLILGILIYTGIRVQELLDMTWEDINFDTCFIRIHGKGNKERLVWSHPDTLSELKKSTPSAERSGYIFGYTQREVRQMIWQALKPYSNAPQLSPHAIRHTFATNMAEKGVNAMTLQKILGHNHLETTQQYIDIGDGVVRDALCNYSIFN